MTKLYIHSTDPSVAGKMKADVYEKILARRKQTRELIAKTLLKADQITLEIGCGHGHFLTDYGIKNPKEICVGIDVNRGRIFKAQKKAERAGLKNVHFIECESLEFLALLPEQIRIQHTWILFPDPWPKKRHLKNRIVQTEFLEALGKHTLPEGRLYLRSDYQPYLEWAQELIRESVIWNLVEEFEWPESAMTVFQELTENRHFSLVAGLEPLK